MNNEKIAHSKGPWTVSTTWGYIRDGKHDLICQFFNRNTVNYKNFKANAQRAAECVNAFEGIANPTEFMAVVKDLELDAFKTMQAERNKLHTAIEAALAELENGNTINAHAILCMNIIK